MNTPTCSKLKSVPVKKSSPHKKIFWMGPRPSQKQIQSKMAFWLSELINRDPILSKRDLSRVPTTKEDEARAWLGLCVKNPRGCHIPCKDGALIEFTAYEIQKIQALASTALGISIPTQTSTPLPPEGIFIPIPQGIEEVHISEPRGILTKDGTIILGVEVYVVSGGQTFFSWSYAYGISEESVRQRFYSDPASFRLMSMN